VQDLAAVSCTEGAGRMVVSAWTFSVVPFPEAEQLNADWARLRRVRSAGPLAVCLWNESRGQCGRVLKIAFDHENGHVILKTNLAAEICSAAVL
jgi:hypothetical protein